MRTLLNRWLLPMAAGALLVSAFPPFNVGQDAWFALVPLLFALEGCRPGEAFRRGYITGLVFFTGTVWWTIYTTAAGAPFGAALTGVVLLVAVLALYLGAAAAWWSVMTRWLTGADVVWRNLLVTVLGAAGWVTLEWVRGNFIFGGFGWNLLGVSQWQTQPLIQFADVTGVYGVSALMCLVNFGFYFTVRRFLPRAGQAPGPRRLSWELYVTMILVCGAFVYGLRVIQRNRQAAPAGALRLAMAQGNIPQSLKFDPAQKPVILERYRTLTEPFLSNGVDLIIWPETATPEPLRYDPESFGLVTNLARRANAYLLTGTIDVTPNKTPVEPFNAAILVRPDGRLEEIYRKMHLVPFGEYVPLRKALPFIKWLVPIEGSFERGADYTVFQLADCRAARFGVVICFEDTVPELYRRFVQRGVDFMINLTNDAWFKTSSEPEIHLANAVFRAVENRRPLVRATNHGITCVVDECGVVQVKAQPFAAGSLTCELSWHGTGGQSFYTRHGNVFAWGCVALTAVTGLVAWRKKAFAVESRA